MNLITDSADCRHVQVDSGCECDASLGLKSSGGPDSAESEPVWEQKMSAVVKTTYVNLYLTALKRSAKHEQRLVYHHSSIVVGKSRSNYA